VLVTVDDGAAELVAGAGEDGGDAGLDDAPAGEVAGADEEEPVAGAVLGATGETIPCHWTPAEPFGHVVGFPILTWKNLFALTHA